MKNLKDSWKNLYHIILSKLDVNKPGNMKMIAIIELTVKNMMIKKTRTFVTIGGMAIGIGAIVFLVSLGYGLQDLVINRVARLEEMRQTTVSTQVGNQRKINDKTLSEIGDIPNVEEVLPLISLVGNIRYKDSETVMAAYGTTSEFLEQSAIKPTTGKIFESNMISLPIDQKKEEKGDEYSEIMEAGERIYSASYEIEPDTWIKIRSSHTTKSEILGYTKRIEGQKFGTKIWGSSYLSDDDVGRSGENSQGESLGYWLEAKVPLWKKGSCDVETDDCLEGNYIQIKDGDGSQLEVNGFFALIGVQETKSDITDSKVLGITDDGSGSLELINVDDEENEVMINLPTEIQLDRSSPKEAVASLAMLDLLGISKDEAVGEKFEVSFVAVGSLLEDPNDRIQSAPIEYTIIGVIPEVKTPIFYVPLIDIKQMGITSYSQLKVVVNSQDSLAKVRQQIEVMGYRTNSVADTVSQINALFASARTILALLGMVALSVATLGMFNTLTVSLLERTREVGLMKALGMKSHEINSLFLSESIIIGFLGGVIGILIGYVAGKIVSVIISIFTVARGVGIVNVSTIPIPFIIAIAFLSLLVGLLTGIFPTRRATKISALNALRYE